MVFVEEVGGDEGDDVGVALFEEGEGDEVEEFLLLLFLTLH